ncbi:hypothetical protein [Streptomyces sp. R35]|uniref:Uncharacterized protein n=1 Tax=Streptomyces sp. R35 TaxID=3238630 RepID=A0AB39SMF8_9ACTN
MEISARRTIFLSSTALLLCPALTSPALAADGSPAPSPAASAAEDSVINTAPPEEPEENVTDVPDSAVDEPAVEPTYTGKPQPGNTPGAADCSPTTFIYKPTSQGKQYHRGVGAAQQNTNDTSRTARSTFASEMTGEVGVSFTDELETSVSAMVTTIKTKYSVTVSTKLTAKIGNSFSVDTPPHKSTNAKYGVYRLKHTGQSWIVHANCTSSPKHNIVRYTPHRVGWYLWES